MGGLKCGGGAPPEGGGFIPFALVATATGSAAAAAVPPAARILLPFHLERLLSSLIPATTPEEDEEEALWVGGCPYVWTAYSEDQEAAMLGLLYGRRKLTKYHVLVSRVILFCKLSLGVPSLVEAISKGKKLEGALGFTVHDKNTNHFFSCVLDLANPASLANECCWGVKLATSGKALVGTGDDNLFASSADKCKIVAAFSEEQNVQQEEWKGEGVLGAPRLLGIYPSVDCKACESVMIHDSFCISFNCGLPPLPFQISDSLELSYKDATPLRPAIGVERSWAPFCCKGVIKMHHRRLRRDSIFQALLARRGSQPDVVYEVKTMKLSGGVFDDKFFELKDGQVNQINGPFHTKLHAFKNYYCATHKYWFSVDLFKRVEDPNKFRPTRTTRMSPFTRLDNWEFINHFFTTVGFKKAFL